jgi:hypothetical protein
VPDKPHTTNEENDLDAGWSDDDSGVSERPTVAPPFDLESYAKQDALAPSSDVILKPPLGPLRSGGGMPAGGGGSLEDRIDELLQESGEFEDSAIRAPSDTAITMPPPPPGPPSPGQAKASSRAAGHPSGTVPSAAGPASDPLSRRETPQGMQQIEAARALSARDDLGTGSLLSLANMRVPSNLPPRPQPDDPVITLVESEEVGAAPELETVDPSADPQKEMQERFALGDYSGALVMAESLLDENPTHVEAREYAESCRAVLQQMYTAKIGPLNRVPVVEVAREQLRWLSIDHRAGFVLSLVDGVSSLEMILDVSGMPPLDALRILFELVQQRIISLRED